jgi:hypothetical protein
VGGEKGQNVTSNKVSFKKECAMKGIHPHHLGSGMQGLPGLGEGLRCWLSWFRREQKDCPLI